MITGAEIIVKSLEEEGVEVVFGYPGGAVIPLYDKLYDSSLKHVLVRHEQAAAHAADGYARATGKTGVAIATSGPGATNLVTGIATAAMDSIPMVVFTGQVALPAIGRDSFQEADITGITLPIVNPNAFNKDLWGAFSIPFLVTSLFMRVTPSRIFSIFLCIFHSPKLVLFLYSHFQLPTSHLSFDRGTVLLSPFSCHLFYL
jgi:glyoxylate carboligase